MMIEKFQIEMMKKAYGIFYEIENRLRYFANKKLEKEYGYNWEVSILRKVNNLCTRKNFSQLNYHELVSYYRIFPILTSALPSGISLQLYRLNSIRNNIAHNRLITENELELLNTMNALLTTLLND